MFQGMDDTILEKFDAHTSSLSRREIQKLVIAYVLARSIGYITLTDITIGATSDNSALKLGKTKAIYLGVALTDASPLQFLTFNKATDRKWTTTQSLQWYGWEEASIVVRAKDKGDFGFIKIPSETLCHCWRSTESKTRMVQECKVNGLGYQLSLSFDVMATPTDKPKIYQFIISVVSLLAMIHVRLYKRHRLLTDLKAAISQQVLLKNLVHSISICAPSGPTASAAGGALVRIACALRDLLRFHFSHTGGLADIAKGIADLKPFVAGTATHPTADQHGYCRLGRDYMDLYLKTREESYSEKARLYLRNACMSSPDDLTPVRALATVLDCSFGISPDVKKIWMTPRRDVSLVGVSMEDALGLLGSDLVYRLKLTPGRLDMIDEAISCLRAANALSTFSINGIPKMPKWEWLAMLSRCFKDRFECSDQLVDLEEAILLLTQGATQMKQADRTDFTPVIYHSLSVLRSLRYDKTFIPSDLEEAILAGRKSIKLTNEGDPALPSRHSSLGADLYKRYDLLHTIADLKDAICQLKKALYLTTKDHPTFKYANAVLSAAYLELAESGQDPDALAQSIAFGHASVEGIEESSPSYLELIPRLSSAYILRSKSDACRQPQDLEFAIGLIRQTIRRTNPLTSSSGVFFVSLVGHLSGNSTGYEQECAELLEKVATSQTMDHNVRLFACTGWMAALTSTPASLENIVTITQAYNIMLELMEPLFGLQNGTMEQCHRSFEHMESRSMMAPVVWLGIKMGNVNLALQCLERSQCLTWKQLNGLRTPLDELREYDEALAHRVLSVSRALESAGGRESVVAVDAPLGQRMSHQERVLGHAQLIKERENLLQTVRSIPGFDRFLMLPSCSDLFSNLPEGGHVVVFNVWDDLCHAIVLKSGRDNALPVHLPKFSESRVVRLSEELHTNLVSLKARYRFASHSESAGTLDSLDDENRGVKPYKQAYQAAAAFSDRLKEAEAALARILRVLWTDLVKPITDVLGITSSDSPGRIWWCPTGALSFLPIHAAGIYSSTSGDNSILSDYAISSYIPTVSSLTSIRLGVSGSATIVALCGFARW